MKEKELLDFRSSASVLFDLLLYKIDGAEVLTHDELCSNLKEYKDASLFVLKLMNNKPIYTDFCEKMGCYFRNAIHDKGLRFENGFLDLLFWIKDFISVSYTEDLEEYLYS